MRQFYQASNRDAALPPRSLRSSLSPSLMMQPLPVRVVLMLPSACQQCCWCARQPCTKKNICSPTQPVPDSVFSLSRSTYDKLRTERQQQKKRSKGVKSNKQTVIWIRPAKQAFHTVIRPLSYAIADMTSNNIKNIEPHMQPRSQFATLVSHRRRCCHRLPISSLLQVPVARFVRHSFHAPESDMVSALLIAGDSDKNRFMKLD